MKSEAEKLDFLSFKNYERINANFYSECGNFTLCVYDIIDSYLIFHIQVLNTYHKEITSITTRIDTFYLYKGIFINPIRG